MRGRINTIMQTCFFAISGILQREQAIDAIKESIRKAYGKKGTEIVQMNLNAVDHTLSHLSEVQIPDRVSPQPQVHQISPKRTVRLFPGRSWKNPRGSRRRNPGQCHAC